MSRKFRQLTEAQIAKARAEGKLSGLQGEGEPLPHRPGDAYIDGADAIGHRIMAEAGALPEEILLKRQLAEAQASLAVAPADQQKDAMAKVADLQMRLSIAAEARRKFLKN